MSGMRYAATSTGSLPQQQASSLQQKTSFPQQKANLPQQKSSYPQQHASSPLQQAISTQQHASSPLQQASSTQQQASSTQQQASSKQQQASSTQQQASSTQQQASSKQQQAISPLQKASSTQQQASSTQQQATSTQQQASSTQQQASSPLQQASSTQQQASSTQQQASSTQQQASSTQQQASFPLQQASSTQQQASSTQQHDSSSQQEQRGSFLHQPGSEPLQYVTMGAVLQAAARRHPDRVAVRSCHEDLQLTYQQLLTQADALGCGLRARGLRRGDRLGIWAHNCSTWILGLVAALRVGVIPVAINPIFEKPELSFCIKKTSLKGLLIGDESTQHRYYQKLNELVPELRGAAPGHLRASAFPSLTTVLTAAAEPEPGTETCAALIKENEETSTHEVSRYGAEISPDDGCIIHFTSGTTGNPKAALDSHFGVVNNTYYVGKRNLLHEEHHRVCVQVPIFHALGSVLTVLASLQHGATLVLAGPTYSVTANAKALYNEECSVIVGTPTMFVDLVALARQRGEAPPCLRVALTAGAPCSPTLFKDIQKYLNVACVKSLYGMTETTGCVFQSVPGETMEQVTETVGYLQDHLQVKVVDDEGRLVPFGTPGQLLTRGYNIMIGYWDEPEKTRQTLDTNGWLKTGDQFIISEDGYGRIVGRAKDIIVRGGENIAPKEVEDHLNTHTNVMESQVIGVSEARLGEQVCAVVRLREGGTLTLDDLQLHCVGHLARYKIPRLLYVVENFPKTASGKIQKYKLREMVETGQLQ